MSNKTRVAVRLKKDLIEEVIEIMGLEGQRGSKSDAVRKALRFYRDNWKKTIDKFEMEFGTEDKKIIKEHLEK